MPYRNHRTHHHEAVLDVEGGRFQLPCTRDRPPVPAMVCGLAVPTGPLLGASRQLLTAAGQHARAV